MDDLKRRGITDLVEAALGREDGDLAVVPGSSAHECGDGVGLPCLLSPGRIRNIKIDKI